MKVPVAAARACWCSWCWCASRRPSGGWPGASPAASPPTTGHSHPDSGQHTPPGPHTESFNI